MTDKIERGANHLTLECNELLAQVMKCNEEHKFGKFFGACDTICRKYDKCIMKDYERRRKESFEKSKNFGKDFRNKNLEA